MCACDTALACDRHTHTQIVPHACPPCPLLSLTCPILMSQTGVRLLSSHLSMELSSSRHCPPAKQTKRRKQRSAAAPGMADTTIDLTDESSDVEVCNADDDVIVVKETAGKNTLTVLVHEKGRGAPVTLCRRSSPNKRQRTVAPAPPAPPSPAPKKLKCPVCLDSVSVKLCNRVLADLMSSSRCHR